MSQYPPSGPGRPIDDGEDEEEYLRRPQPGDAGRGGAGGGDRQFSYYQEERYWTDYLRIAAPVIGVILLLGLAWFWINSLIGDDETPVTPTTTTAGVPPIITGGTPTVRSNLGTPIPVATSPGTGAPGGAATPAAPQATGKFKTGDKVVVANTGGSGANMRADASTGASVVATLPDSTSLTITGGPKQANNYTWWQVKSAQGDGWIVEDFLKAGS